MPRSVGLIYKELCHFQLDKSSNTQYMSLWILQAVVSDGRDEKWKKVAVANIIVHTWSL